MYYAKCLVCSSGEDYVGSSIQLLHDRAYQHYNKQTEAIFQHNSQFQHSGLSFEYKILSSCHTLKDLLFQEAIYIKRIKPTLNRRFELEDVTRFID